MDRRELAPLAALVAILVITTAWWALALWPLPADAPAWLERARLVCFGSTRETLPSTAGWLLLAGEPLAMLGLLLAGWSQALGNSIRRLRATAAGRFAAATGLVLVLAGLGAATLRIRAARSEAFDPGGLTAPAELLGHAPPPLDLIDQHGNRVTLDQFAGRPVLVVFAYAHCATVCPLVVHEALTAQRQLPGAGLLIVTLDPWRDTPARLPAIARQWALGDGAHALSGDVANVERVADAWEYPRTRDAATGEITHATYLHVVDGAGRLWRAPGRADAVVGLVRGR